MVVAWKLQSFSLKISEILKIEEAKMPDDEYRTKYSAAQKMQLLKSQQAKLEIRAMPAHSKLKLKVDSILTVLPADKDYFEPDSY